MKRQKKPYGSWSSPITPQMVGGKQMRLGHFQAEGDVLYWLEGRPQEAGRVVLMKKTSDEPPQELTNQDYSVRSKVHEYGGGDFLVSTDQIFFVNGADQDIYQILDDQILRVTERDHLRFADMYHDVQGKRLLAVCEDHGSSRHLPENYLVEILLEENRGAVNVLARGNDFYASPALSPCGSYLSFLSWSRPYMPWEAAKLSIVEMTDNGAPGRLVQMIGGEGEAVFQPLWQGQDVYFVFERGNWNNLSIAKAEDGFSETAIIWPANADFGRPHWVFSQRSFAFLSPHRLVASYFDAGKSKIAVFDLAAREAQELEAPFLSFDMIDVSADRICGIATKEDMPLSLVCFSEQKRPESFSVIRPSLETNLNAADFSAGKLIRFPTRDGGQAFALYYPPANSKFSWLEGELPPMMVSAHGGPTGMADRGLKLKIQYWTSRGFAFLDVDYRGSSGYGKAYREKLDGGWGVLDVCDVVDGAEYCVGQGLADKTRLVISGTSAGGLTVLNALAHHRTFSAGGCYYGVSDLQALCDDTHKFEVDYVYRLTDSSPETAADVFQDISPKNHIESITAPVIFFQGDEDPIVPPEQSRDMFSRLKAKGNLVSYTEFAGESHGFRQEASLKTALAQEYLFYAQILGFDPCFKGSEQSKLIIENKKPPA